MVISRSTGSPSLNLPKDANFSTTTLLIHGDGTSGANNTMFLENSGSETYIPFKNTNSIYLPTTSDRVSTSSSYTFAGVFTLEFFMNIPASLNPSTGSTVCGVFTAGGFNMWYDGTSISPNIYGTGNIFSSTFNPSLNTWYHVVVTRNASNLMTMYVNGVSVGSTTTSASYTSGQFSLQYSGGYGYISNVRLTNTDVYRGSVTVPTSSLTSIDGTQFILAQSNRIIDSSTINQTITTSAGTPAISSGGPAIIPFGKPSPGTFSPYPNVYPNGWSNYFNGSTDYLNNIVPTPSSIPTNGNFTMEFWLYNNASTWSTNFDITDGGTGALAVYFNGGNFRYAPQGSASASLGSVASLSVGQWHHFVVVRSGGNIRGYADGVALAAAQADAQTYNNGSAQAFTRIGGITDGYFNGYISNFRFVNNANIYDINSSTYRVPTSPLTAVANTQLLTCQTYTFLGSNTTTSNSFITTSGTPSPQPFSPFAISTRAYSKNRMSGSIAFNGSTDYIQSGQYLQSLNPGANNFTLECWIYLTAGANRNDLIDLTASSGNNRIQLYTDTSGNLIYSAGVGSPSATITSAAITDARLLNRWNHVALSRNSNVARLFFNGVLYSNSADTSVWTDPFRFTSGKDSAGSTYVNGTIGDIRILNGTGLYTTLFTPPTNPLTAIGNTVLLINSTNAGIFDNTSKNNIATYGSAAISSTQSKFGGTSISLPGSGSYLVIPYQNFPSIGSGDFTIEYWIYFNSVSGTQTIIAKWNQTVGSGEFVFYVSGGTLNLSYGAFSEISPLLSGGTVTTGQWYHIAVVRSGSTFTQYINGTSTSTATSSATRTVNVNVTLGNYYSSSGTFPATGSTDLNAYIDDLRVTKSARYTANFTPPARKFEDR